MLDISPSLPNPKGPSTTQDDPACSEQLSLPLPSPPQLQPPPAQPPSAAAVTSPSTSSGTLKGFYIALALGLIVANWLAWAALAAWLFSPEVGAVTLALSVLGTGITLLFILGETLK